LADYLRYLRDTHQWNIVEENFFEIFAPPEDTTEEAGAEDAASAEESAVDAADGPEGGEGAAATTAQPAPDEAADGQ
jgi:hypothetical protein